MAFWRASIIPCVLLACLTTLAAPAVADVYVEAYADDDGMSGVQAGADVGGCEVHAVAEYMDFDGDMVPDTIPPGGRPPNAGAGTTCLD